jgi:hypothetical protein
MNIFRSLFRISVITLLTLGLLAIVNETIYLVKLSQEQTISNPIQNLKKEKKIFKAEPNITNIPRLPGAIIIGEAKCGNKLCLKFIN